MNALNHYTLNTGHNRLSPRAEVGDDLLPKMAELLETGEHDLGAWAGLFAGFRLVVPVCPTGWLGTLYRGPAPLVTIGVAGNEEEATAIWRGLQDLYLKVTELPTMRAADFKAPKQPPLPWVSVALIAPWILPDWVGDIERCLAWAWLARKKNRLTSRPS
jgi:hypothetical protein